MEEDGVEFSVRENYKYKERVKNESSRHTEHVTVA